MSDNDKYREAINKFLRTFYDFLFEDNYNITVLNIIAKAMRTIILAPLILAFYIVFGAAYVGSYLSGLILSLAPVAAMLSLVVGMATVSIVEYVLNVIASPFKSLYNSCCYGRGYSDNSSRVLREPPASPNAKDTNANPVHAELEQRRQKAINPAQQMHNQRSASFSQQSPAANESYFARLTRRFSPW